MQKPLYAAIFLAAALALAGCFEDTKPPETETETETAQPSEKSEVSKKGDDGSIFTTIYCKLTSQDGNTSTTTTYFKYDETTVNHPSELHLNHAPYVKHSYDPEIWAKGLGRFRLIDTSIEIPTAASKSAFRPDPTGMYYKHGFSWHFFDPLMKSEGGWFEFSTISYGQFYFGKRIGPEEFEGYLEFTTGNQYGGTYGGWFYKGEYGHIDGCSEEKPE